MPRKIIFLIPPLPAGVYRLAVVVYSPATQQRLRADGADQAQLAPLSID